MNNQEKPSPLANLTEKIWWAGVKAVEARHCTESFVSVDQNAIRFGDFLLHHDQYHNILVVGGGKGIGEMGAGLEAVLLDHIPSDKKLYGRLNVPDDKVISLKVTEVVGCRPPGQNLPTERVVASTSRIIQLIQSSHKDDLILFLIAGGGSALLELPIPPLKLDELQSVTRMLSQRGASINQLNAVRRRLSQVKGGGLARMADGRKMITLTISDVLGDPLEIIASGPTVLNSEPDTGAANHDAIQVLYQFSSHPDEIPSAVWSILERSECVPGPLKKSDGQPRGFSLHFVIANNQSAVRSARRKAEELGFAVQSETDFESSNVIEVAERIVEFLEVSAAAATGTKGCLVSGGEPVVSLGPNPGHGGRNQHLVLTVLEKLVVRNFAPEGLRFAVLSGGTDGEDGSTNVAGGFIDESMLKRAIQRRELLEIQNTISSGNSFEWLGRWNALFDTGKTGTNVCDLRIVVFEKD